MGNIVVKQIEGKAYWAHLTKPTANFNKDGFEWSVDVAVDEDTVKELKSYGLGPKIKDNKEYSPYITFRRATVKKAGPKAGEKNEPIRMIGPDGKTPWDTNVLIGNGSVIRVKFSVNENVGGPAKKKYTRADALALQVFDLVPYVAPPKQEFEGNPVAEQPKEANADW